MQTYGVVMGLPLKPKLESKMIFPNIWYIHELLLKANWTDSFPKISILMIRHQKYWFWEGIQTKNFSAAPRISLIPVCNWIYISLFLFHPPITFQLSKGKQLSTEKSISLATHYLPRRVYNPPICLPTYSLK